MSDAKPRRWPLVLLVLVVALPLTAAVGFHLGGWRPAGTTSHGELIRPPRALGEATARSVGGAAVSAASLRGKWTLLYAVPAACAEDCVRSLYAMRMAHVAQTKEYARVRRVVLAGDAQAAGALAASDPDLLVVVASAAQRAALLGEPEGPRVYLADPMGNLIMRFDGAADPVGMRKDLTHLMKHSWVG